MLATGSLLIFCTLAAYLAIWAGLPLPYLLGPLFASAAVSLGARRFIPAEFPYLGGLRFVFIAVVGVLIGAQVTPDLFAQPAHLALSALALVLFVLAAIALNYMIFHVLGRYDRRTAFYSAMPGGLYESIAFGEEAGADPARLMLQQFLRVIAVVTLLPIGLSLWLGEPVGSASGLTLSKPDVPMGALPVALGAIVAGIALGKLLRLPARQLTGPMAVGAALSLSGVITLDVPDWLVNLALIVIGAALGTRFGGLTPRRVAQGLGLAVLSVLGMLAIGAGCAYALVGYTGQPFDLMLVAFAPGGVTEMTLVALSLSGNPAIVTLHHICRIVITVIVLAATAKAVRARL